jgi:hypothetical protein
MNISERVHQIIGDCENNYLEFSQGKQVIKYNQRETLDKIECYINNRYYNREDNDVLFWNISNHRITHFAKLLSPDTKDFMPYGLGSLNHFQAWALRKNVTKWFDEERFYQTLNDVSEGMATYGSQVWKKYKEDGKEKLKEVKLQNLYFNQSVEWIKDADGVVEVHNLNRKQLWDKEGVWENVKDVIEKEGDKATNIKIWEFYGYFGEQDSKPEYKHIIGYGEGDEFIQLWEEEVNIDDCPYIDFHLGRYRGRFLRTGVVERLFELQARINQLVNQNAQATEIASLLLLKSGQPDMIGNVLEQAINGQIIPDDTLQQIGISNVGLQNFLSEIQLIEQHADRLCLTPEIVQGESSPSNTTFRGIATVNSAAVSAFRDYKQNLLEKIADVLMEFIFPSVVKKWKHEDFIEMAEDDEDAEEYIKALTRREELKFLLADVGNVITPDTKSMILKRVEDSIKENGRKVEIPDGFFNFKWGFKMMPTDETVDKSARNDAYFNALQMVMANPAVSEIPLFKQYCEDNGISSWKLTPAQRQDMAQMEQGGQQMPEPKKPDALLSQAQVIQ